jgi:hypothetical protein
MNVSPVSAGAATVVVSQHARLSITHSTKTRAASALIAFP